MYEKCNTWFKYNFNLPKPHLACLSFVLTHCGFFKDKFKCIVNIYFSIKCTSKKKIHVFDTFGLSFFNEQIEMILKLFDIFLKTLI